MEQQDLIDQITFLKETIHKLIEDIHSLQSDLKDNNDSMEKLRFRLIELENKL